MRKNLFLVIMFLASWCQMFGQYSTFPVDNRRDFGEYPHSRPYSNRTDAERMNLKGDVRFFVEKGSCFMDAPVAYYQFDETGRLTALMAEDERGIEKLYDVYYIDKQGRLTERIQVKNGGELSCYPNEDAVRELPESEMTRYVYTYDSGGKPVNVIRWWRDFRHKGLFGYDEKGRLVKEKGTNGEIITYRYAGDHLVMIVVQDSPDSRGTFYQYDSQGKLLSQDVEYEGVISYTYDVKGRMTSRKSSDETIRYTYDENDNLKDGTRYVYDSHGNWIKKISLNGTVATRTYYYGQSPNNFPTWKSHRFAGSWQGMNKKADGSIEHLFMDLDFNNHKISDNFANNMLGTFQYKIQLPGGMPTTFGSYYIYYVRQGGNHAVIKFKEYGPYAEDDDLESAYQALLTYNPQTKAMKISNIVKVIPDAKAGECTIKEQTMNSLQ